MEAGVVLLLLFSLLGIASSLSFYGDSISFVPLQKKTDGTFKVTFYHRQNGRSNCQDQSSFACESGVCTSFDKSSVLQTDQDNTGQGLWCQSEGNTTATVLTNKTSFFLRDSGCCWVPNVEGKTNWTTHTELDLGTRSDTHSLNSCPVTATVSYLRVPQNCFSRIHILAYDPDGDEVKCRFAASNPTNFTLDETACTLTSTGDIQTGIHVFELMIEDFSTKNITLTYSDGTSVFQKAYNTSSPPLCKVKLQFSVEVLLPIPNCDAGFVQPKFLYRTPLHGDILHATVGQTLQLYAQAQAQDASIFDFQVSGPENMTKVFKDDALGKAEVTLSWTPQYTDLYRSVPVCFTAETNHTQSEMRCVVVLVTQASTTQGSPFSRCAQGCLKDPSRRRRRDLSSETVSHYITQGPLQFVGQPVPSAAKDSQDVLMDRSGIPAAVSPQPASPDTKSALESWEIKKLFSSNISTVVFASAFLVSVVLLAAVIHHKKRKQKAEDCNVLIVSEWEN